MPRYLASTVHKQVICLFTLPLLIACNQERTPQSTVLLSDGTVYFKGFITEEFINKTIELLGKSDNKLRITSEGGANTPAITLGNYIYDNETEVIFQIQCYSACANYILPAARKGLVKTGTVVGWHGGAYQGVWEIDLDENPEVKRRIEVWQKIESDLYRKLNIDHNINVYGIINNYDLLMSEPYCMRLAKRGDWQGWTYTMSDLRKMGVMMQFEDNEVPLGQRGGDDIQCYIYPFKHSSG